MHIALFSESSRSGAERRKRADAAEIAGSFTDDYLGFGKDYFDNPTLAVGYGKYAYDGRYKADAERIAAHYGLKPGDKVLEVGCAKGFLLVEFHKLGMDVYGADGSEYAVQNAHPDIANRIVRSDIGHLPFPDNNFALVLGKEILPHVPEDRIRDAVKECMRVSTGKLFFEIQCGRTDRELRDMLRWDASHKTVRSPEWWDAMFAKIGYPGDVHYKILLPEPSAEIA